MPPKPPKAKPRPVPRRAAAAPDAAAAQTATIAAEASAVQAQAPIAPPVGRLDSLVSAAAAAARTSQGGGGRGVPVPLKFKPKNVPRKSKEEREALDAKFEVPVVPTPRPRGGASRGPRGGRGGGGRNDRNTTASASGPFALGSVTTRDRTQKTPLGHFPSKHRPAPSKLDPRPQSLKPEDPPDTHYSSSSDSEGPRMDVEYISLLDAPHSDDSSVDLEPIWGAGAPVRVPRSAHVDRTAQVNTEASSRKGRASSRNGKEVFEETVKVKDEPPDEGGDIPAPNTREASKRKSTKPRSPDVKKRGAPLKPRRRSSAGKRKLPVYSLEDREELEREEEDRAETLRELAGLAGVGVDGGDVGVAEIQAETENQIFVFQFPHLLPQLVLPGLETPVKLESPPPPPQRKLSAKAQQTLLESYPPPGIAGKLRVHRSGRMSMLWGANEEEGPVEMDVRRGAQCEFLQEVVVMRGVSPWGETDVDEEGRRKGVVASLGQVKGRFVVSPDFGKLLAGEKKGRGRRGKGKKGVVGES